MLVWHAITDILTLFTYCHHVVVGFAMLHFHLLSHPKEVHRRSNTGQVIEALWPEHCQRYIWSRQRNVLPKALNTSMALLMPGDQASSSQDEVKGFQHFLIIDSTWQEAKKIYRQSPCLHILPKVSVCAKPSTFILRANQIEGGLSTAEVAVNLLSQQGYHQQAEQLECNYHAFMRQCL
ncbi:tRNA-uridine aminocarboxypropyltransferase [Motilimonas pumila]|uniref:tRNA-uridine aminocarboxypropyltransferase n=1 Tax=Motilimonas pumila TaxID=2303987 RepID=A0A418YFA1_9GAMM|nr:tRNA-uridine aminocarboxypropyltransferase [Motilimonas pumila]RJG47903.1 DTW domain-containing protein [Motilimonas pumila]